MNRAALILLVAGVPALAQAWPTFYSAYADGLAAQAQGNHARAVQAFQRAIALNPRPGRNIRTYGLDFLPVYAPYLRLAESQMALGDLSGAEATLGRSRLQGGESPVERQALQARLEALRVRTAPSPSGRLPDPGSGAPPAHAAQEPAPRPDVSRPPEPVPRAVPTPVPAESPMDAPPQAAPAAPSKRRGPPAPEVRNAWRILPAEAPGVQPSRPAPSAPHVASASGGPPPAPAGARSPGRTSWFLGGIALLSLAGMGGLLFRRRSPGDGSNGPVPADAPAGGAPETVVLAPPTQVPVSRDPNLGRTFGRYMAQRVLGRGGCATAYFGVDLETGEEVAIKVPHPHLMDQEDFRARFRREASLGALLTHPRIVPLLDPGPAEEEPWLVTRFIPGDSLSTHLWQQGPLGIPDAVAIASDVADAIHFAHERGVVHRDLKPANVMVTPGGAVVMDFGIARVLDAGLTATTMFMGTPRYSAPESVVTSKVGPPADWYALGIILFEMLAGQAPFQEESSFQIFEAHRSKPLPDLRAIRPMTPPPLEDLIRRLCAKQPEDRPSGEEVLLTLGRLKATYPPIPPPAAEEPGSEPAGS